MAIDVERLALFPSAACHLRFRKAVATRVEAPASPAPGRDHVGPEVSALRPGSLDPMARSTRTGLTLAFSREYRHEGRAVTASSSRSTR
jgi:hypothetical protein